VNDSKGKTTGKNYIELSFQQYIVNDVDTITAYCIYRLIAVYSNVTYVQELFKLFS